MIKELNRKSAKTKTGYMFGMIEIQQTIESPIKNRINIYECTKYYKKILDELKVVKIKKQKGFKGADWVPIDMYYDFWCISKKFKEVFEGKLKGYWYPTNDENYFIFLLDNRLDIIDKEQTEIKYNEKNLNMACWYEYIENLSFLPEASQEYLFTIPEEPLRVLCSEKFINLIKKKEIKGFEFYKEINYKRKDGSRFDGLRFKNYDEEGNMIE